MLADEKYLTYIFIWRDQLPTGGKGKLALWSKIGSCIQADVLNEAFSWGRGNFIPQVFCRCRDIVRGKNSVLSCNILWQKRKNLWFLFFWKKNLGAHRVSLNLTTPTEKLKISSDFTDFDASVGFRDMLHRKNLKSVCNDVWTKIKGLWFLEFA